MLWLLLITPTFVQPLLAQEASPEAVETVAPETAASEPVAPESLPPEATPEPPAVGEPSNGEPPAAETVILEEPLERERSRRRRTDQQVSIGGGVRVDENELARDVVAIGGPLDISGEVLGDAVSVGGSARISGTVSGDLVVVGGGVFLAETAEIQGDLVSVGGTIQREPGAFVGGEVSEVSLGALFSLGDFRDSIDIGDFSPGFDRGSHGRRAIDLIWSVFGWMLLVLLACLAYLLAERPFERIGAKVVEAPWASLMVGIAAAVLFLPVLLVVVVILAISIIGIPLLLLIPFVLLALTIFAFIGYTAVSYRLAGWADARFGWQLGSPYLKIVVGLLALSILGAFADLIDLGGGPLGLLALLIGFVAVCIKLTASLIGFGAVLLSQFGFGASTVDPLGGSTPPPPPAASEWNSGSPDAMSEPVASESERSSTEFAADEDDENPSDRY